MGAPMGCLRYRYRELDGIGRRGAGGWSVSLVTQGAVASRGIGTRVGKWLRSRTNKTTIAPLSRFPCLSSRRTAVCGNGRAKKGNGVSPIARTRGKRSLMY
jgi:hypothetical protein